MTKTAMTVKEKFAQYPLLTVTERSHLMRESLEERNSDRKLATQTFLEQWPFVKKYEGLMTDLKALKRVKSLEYVSKRISRKFSIIIKILILFI